MPESLLGRLSQYACNFPLPPHSFQDLAKRERVVDSCKWVPACTNAYLPTPPTSLQDLGLRESTRTASLALPETSRSHPPSRTWPRGSGWWTAASSATSWRRTSRSRPWAWWRRRPRCEGRIGIDRCGSAVLTCQPAPLQAARSAAASSAAAPLLHPSPTASVIPNDDHTLFNSPSFPSLQRPGRAAQVCGVHQIFHPRGGS